MFVPSQFPIMTSKQSLKTFKRIPIYIVEYHHEAIQFMHKAIRTRHLPLENNILVHLDSHPDLLIPKNMLADDAFDKEKLYDQLSIENWILPGAYTGIFEQVVWLKPFWAQQMKPGTRKVPIGKHIRQKTIKVHCDEAYFLYEGLYSTLNNMENIKETTIDVINVTFQEDANDFNALQKIIESSECKRFILDIDLDFFSTKNPFKIMYAPGNLYERLKDLYQLPKGCDDIDKLMEARDKQLDILESAFSYLDKHRTLDGWIVKDGNCDEISSKINAIVQDVTPLYEHIDWTIVHSAGCTWDDSDEPLPHHESTKDELNGYFSNFFCHFLKSLPPPTLITISRSTDDDYCPKDVVNYIQEKVLTSLETRFGEDNLDKPVLWYLNEEVG